MPNEVKKGSYKEFNRREASWVCPHCHKDALKLDEQFRYHGILKRFSTFFCVYCGFDSEYYGITIKNNDNINEAHKKILREWNWIKFLLKKGYVEGVNDGKLMAKDEQKLAEIQSAFDELLNCLKIMRQ